MASRAVAVDTASRFVGTDVLVLESALGMRDVVEEIQTFARALVFEKSCPAPMGYQNPCVVDHTYAPLQSENASSGFFTFYRMKKSPCICFQYVI
jgi:hypothetical protein